MPRKRGQQKTGTCVYCGAVGPITDDHIPPKNIFPRPRPTNLITVPSCPGCNNGADLDDAYFRQSLFPRAGITDHPEASRLKPAFLKDFSDPKKQGFIHAFLSTITENVDVVTPTGVITGEKATTYAVNLNRLRKVAARAVRGLFYVETGRQLPYEYLSIALAEDDCSDPVHRPRFSELGRMAASLPSLEAEHARGNGVVRYWYKVFDEDPNTSIWLLRFFENYHFVGITTSPLVFTPGKFGHLSFP